MSSLLGRLSVVVMVFTGAVSAAHADDKTDALVLLGQVQNAIASSNDGPALASAAGKLREILGILNGSGDGSDASSAVYCQQVSDYYILARSSDRTYLESNGSKLEQCSRQQRSARHGLACVQFAQGFYQPILVATRDARSNDGTDLASCEQVVRFSTPTTYCRAITTAGDYIPSHISDGGNNGGQATKLPACLQLLSTQR